MDNSKIRILLLLAIALLAFALWNKWQLFSHPPLQTTPTAQHQGDSNGSSTPELSSVSQTSTPRPAPLIAKNIAPIVVQTDVMNVKISPVGGKIISTTLVKYAQSSANKSPMPLLFDNQKGQYFVESGLTGSGIKTDAIRYQTAKMHYELGQRKELTVSMQARADGLMITKTLTFHRDSYQVDVNYHIQNLGSKIWQGRFFGQILRTPPQKLTHHFFDFFSHKSHAALTNYMTFTGAAVSTPNDHYNKLSFEDMAESNINQTVKTGWAAMIEHYFITAWIPTSGKAIKLYTRDYHGLYAVGLANPTLSIRPGHSATTGAKIYMGPAVMSRLKATAPYLDLTINFGWLWFLSIPIFMVMSLIHHIVGNWGWSIILVTLLIKLVLYPLSAKSYHSMAKMRRLQPRMQQLRETHAGDREAIGKATMQLYKKEGVSPLGGCLPIVVQIPIFIGLYYMLLASVELRQAPFIFWIKDLSAADPYFVLPIIMGISMFVQQRLSPSPPDPLQAKLFMLMPVLFTVLFLHFPSGLVLYWIVNNVVSILQQWYILRHYREKKTVKK